MTANIRAVPTTSKYVEFSSVFRSNIAFLLMFTDSQPLKSQHEQFSP